MISTNSITEKAKKIKLLAMDVDGTMTNGRVYYSKNGEELKMFSIRDGMGIELLHRTGLGSAIITSENSQIVMARGNKLKIEHFILGSRNKKHDLETLAINLKIGLDEIAYIGDDINDMQAMQIAGLSACPADSTESILATADYICSRKGGEGAIRELVELILISQNKPIVLPEKW